MSMEAAFTIGRLGTAGIDTPGGAAYRVDMPEGGARMYFPLLARARVGRRGAGLSVAALGLVLLAGCSGHARWHSIDVQGSYPALQFQLTRASDGKTVTADDYRGKVVMLYFGFTSCTTVCPVTLANVSRVFRRLGKDASHVQMLFVTVDPKRDTASALTKYLGHFGFARHVDGLRGTSDGIAKLARRYRVAYSVSPAKGGQSYQVTHSSAIYVFDGSGKLRLLVSSLASAEPDIDGTASDLKRLASQARPKGLFARLEALV